MVNLKVKELKVHKLQFFHADSPFKPNFMAFQLFNLETCLPLHIVYHNTQDSQYIDIVLIVVQALDCV